MKIGISSWGFLSPNNGINSPDGGRSHRRFWIKALIDEGNEVFWMQKNRDFLETKNVIFSGNDEWANKVKYDYEMREKLDVVLFEFRWPIKERNYVNNDHLVTLRNDMKSNFDCNQNDLIKQWQLIHHYGKQGTRLIIWDKDLKLDNFDLQALSKYNYAIAFPSFLNNECFDDMKIDNKNLVDHYGNNKCSSYQLFVPMDYQALKNRYSDFWYGREKTFAGLTYNWNREIYVGYVGNNYERDTQLEKYVYPIAKTFKGKVHLYGNWKEFKGPDEVIRHNRITFGQAEELMKGFLCTINLSKDIYAKNAFYAARLNEAMWNFVPTFFPKEIITARELLKHYTNGSVTNFGDENEFLEYVENMSLLTSQQRKHYIANQKESFCSSTERYFSTEVWLNCFHQIVNKAQYSFNIRLKEIYE